MNITVPNEDSKQSLDGFIASQASGTYDPSDPFSIYLSKRFDSKEESWEAYWHERTHLQLYTSTAFGHVQQIFSAILNGLNDSDVFGTMIISPFQQIVSLLHEASWEVQEGAATITPHLFRNPFSLQLIYPTSYSHLPQRYSSAATHIAKAVGGLLPVELAGYGYIAVNAIAQFCLNTDILKFSAAFIRNVNNAGQSEGTKFFEHLSDGRNYPSNRLYRLISTLYDDEKNEIPHALKISFFFDVQKLDFVLKEPTGLRIQAETKEQMLAVQDTFNYSVMTTLQDILPDLHVYSRVAEMQSDIKEFYAACEESKWAGIVRNDISDNISARAQFNPTIKDL